LARFPRYLPQTVKSKQRWKPTPARSDEPKRVLALPAGATSRVARPSRAGTSRRKSGVHPCASIPRRPRAGEQGVRGRGLGQHPHEGHPCAGQPRPLREGSEEHRNPAGDRANCSPTKGRSLHVTNDGRRVVCSRSRHIGFTRTA
jgi:hypothetical protein